MCYLALFYIACWRVSSLESRLIWVLLPLSTLRPEPKGVLKAGYLRAKRELRRVISDAGNDRPKSLLRPYAKFNAENAKLYSLTVLGH